MLEIILKDDTSKHVGTIGNLLHLLESFDFAFKMHLMRNILGITNELSKALQRKDQDIVKCHGNGKTIKGKIANDDSRWVGFSPL